jgi:phenol 2-monooxygenase
LKIKLKALRGRIERFFLDSLKEYSDIKVERGVLPESMSFDESQAEDLDAYPIEVVLQHLTEKEANPHQSNATNGAAKSDGLFRSNMAADDTQELLSKAATNGRAGSKETVRAKYMIGCDGAHSWVRNQLGYKLEGEQTDYIWYEKKDSPYNFTVTLIAGLGVFWTLYQSLISVSRSHLKTFINTDNC